MTTRKGPSKLAERFPMKKKPAKAPKPPKLKAKPKASTKPKAAAPVDSMTRTERAAAAVANRREIDKTRAAIRERVERSSKPKRKHRLELVKPAATMAPDEAELASLLFPQTAAAAPPPAAPSQYGKPRHPRTNHYPKWVQVRISRELHEALGALPSGVVTDCVRAALRAELIARGIPVAPTPNPAQTVLFPPTEEGN
jgi:hypothetical protein